jgi:hypothetical protein
MNLCQFPDKRNQRFHHRPICSLSPQAVGLEEHRRIMDANAASQLMLRKTFADKLPGTSEPKRYCSHEAPHRAAALGVAVIDRPSSCVRKSNL